MRLAKLLEDSRDFHTLKTTRSYPIGKLLLEVIEKLRDEERGGIEKKPMVNTEDVREDVRFKLGKVAMANLILGLPDEAFKHISKLEGRETK